MANYAHQEAIVMTALAGAVSSNLPCPSNNELAGLLDAASVSTPVNVLARLQKKGLIEIERFATSRIVTICATGKSTAGDRSKAAHWRVTGAKNPGAYTGKARGDSSVRTVVRRPSIRDDALPPSVSRDPCPRCGIRSDIGCQHVRAPLSMGAF